MPKAHVGALEFHQVFQQQIPKHHLIWPPGACGFLVCLLFVSDHLI